MNRATWEARAIERRLGRSLPDVLRERARRDWIERNADKESSD